MLLLVCIKRINEDSIVLIKQFLFLLATIQKYVIPWFVLLSNKTDDIKKTIILTSSCTVDYTTSQTVPP